MTMVGVNLVYKGIITVHLKGWLVVTLEIFGCGACGSKGEKVGNSKDWGL
jgi:hypothetical protein